MSLNPANVAALLAESGFVDRLARVIEIHEVYKQTRHASSSTLAGIGLISSAKQYHILLQSSQKARKMEP
ncbi:hypothetical protein EON83_13640 [bacterium]|nr:MAG: hypothetical protein EON83_13640 [bacterium]